MELLIGDKRWSSWSMRPWLVLKHAGADFTETLVPLRRPETHDEIIAAGSPNGQMPFLKHDDLGIGDSLAICEYVAEIFPQAQLWPADPKTRALARFAASEMHSGFHSLRGECPMDLHMRETITLSEATHNDIRRIVELWSGLRDQFASAGPFLTGAWSIADAFYTPVATRFLSYGVKLSDFGDRGSAGAYAEALLETPEYAAWASGA